MEWILTDASPGVRAVDLGFAMVGLRQTGDHAYYTASSKTWCPIGIGCQEWSCTAQQATVGMPAFHTQSVAAAGFPPSPLPAAHSALVTPGRSNGIGMWTATGAAGVGAYSSQRTLPFQLFQQADRTLGVGSARINTNLRCGSVLPVHLRFGFFRDITADGTVNMDDCVVWTRRQYPLADWRYRLGLVWKVGNDYTSYTGSTSDVTQRITFNETLEYVRAIALLSDNMTSIWHLVGWQGSGHDTLYPSLNRLNRALGTDADLRRLFEASQSYNAFISYHANTDEAYWNFTAVDPASVDPSKGHPIAQTDDGRHNPDADPNILSKDPSGALFVWSDNADTRTDPLQGPAYHISKTKDAASGQRWRRLQAMLDTVPLASPLGSGGPLGSTLHSDAYRDIDTSWEDDERGYIAEDEEMACGCAADAAWLHARNLTLGVEGSNGMASVGGPSTPSMDVFDYYWHGSADLGVWARIVTGTDQLLDDDVTPSSATNPLRHWEEVANRVYLHAKVNAMRLTDPELLSNGQFAGGGDMAGKWPYGGDLEFVYSQSQGSQVFVPVVQLMRNATDVSKTALTELHPSRAHIYQQWNGLVTPIRQSWTLPLSWVGKRIAVASIKPTGKIAGIPNFTVSGRMLTIESVPGQPVEITAEL
jgi:hypothetical protein